MIILDSIHQICQQFPDKTALYHYQSRDNQQSISYKQLDARSNSCASYLFGRGLKPGQIAGIFMPRSIDHVVAMLAILKCGAAFYSLHHGLSVHQVEYITARCRSPFLLIDNSALIKLANAKSGTLPYTTFILMDDQPMTPVHQACRNKLAAHKIIESFSVKEDAVKNFLTPITGKDHALSLFTSGSTGAPQGVMISHQDLWNRVYGECRDFRLTGSDRLLSLLPFSFDVGLNQLYTALSTGAELILLNSWFVHDICSVIDVYRITGVSAVPAIWRELLATETGRLCNSINKLRYLTISGGDLSRAHLKQLRELVPDVGIYKTYGQTETFRSGILFPEDFNGKMTSVGKPVAGTDVFIINSRGKKCKPGEHGQIIHRGDGTMLGYIDDPKSTRRKIRKYPLQFSPAVYRPAVVYTGDIGMFDEDGFLYILGRKDKMLKIRGNRVYPGEILEVIYSCDQVKEAVVFGIKNERGETAIYSEIILKSGSSVGMEDVASLLAANLPSYMVPQEIIQVVSFPRTTSGKIKLAAVEEKYYEKR